MMKKTIFFIILAFSVTLVFSQSKPCCKNKSGNGKVACKTSQSEVELNEQQVQSSDGSKLATSELSQCSKGIQKKCNSESNCSNSANVPWWVFWKKKSDCCKAKS